MLLILRQILFAETFFLDGLSSDLFFAHDHFSRYHSSPNFTFLNQVTQTRFIQPVLAGVDSNHRPPGYED